MKKGIISSLLLAAALLIPLTASASQLKAYVEPFTATPQEAAGLMKTLQRLVVSRIAGDGITTVDSAAEAEVVISGSFTQIGKVFSLDAAAKLRSGETVATAFEQGESQDELIPALGRVAAKLKEQTLKLRTREEAAPAAAAPAAAGAPTPQQAKGEPNVEPGMPLWVSQRLEGVQTSIAPAGMLGGARALLIAEGHKLRLYRQEKGLSLVAEAEIPQREKVLSVEATGSAADGTLRAYLTTIDEDTPASRVYSFEKSGLRLLAEKLPYFFRGVALDGGATRMFAQQMGRSEDFYGPVYEVAEAGGKIELKNALQLPRYANVFNFNRFRDADGKAHYVTFSNDGYLVVSSEKGEELWRSPDKFGGSETYFQREANDIVRTADDSQRWHFLDQRIMVTGQGNLVVLENSGFFVLGNQRSYTKHALASFSWNGSSLEERWKTKTAPNYVADYFYQGENKELVLLEVVQKEGLFAKGGSAVQVLRAP